MTTTLVTRAYPDAELTASIYRAKGDQVIIEPMMTIKFIDFEQIPRSTILFFTSANGVRSFIRHHNERDYVVYAVGTTTADEAYSFGFRDIHTAGGDSDSLLKLLLSSNKEVLITHISGKHVTEDIAGELCKQGFQAKRVIAYEGVAIDDFSQPTIEAIKQSKIDQVLFFSSRTAEIFSQLIVKHKLSAKLKKVSAICASDAIAQKLERKKWSKIKIEPEILTDKKPEQPLQVHDKTKSVHTKPILIGAASTAAVIGIFMIAKNINQNSETLNSNEKILTLESKLDQLSSKFDLLHNSMLESVEQRMNKLDQNISASLEHARIQSTGNLPLALKNFTLLKKACEQGEKFNEELKMVRSTISLTDPKLIEKFEKMEEISEQFTPTVAQLEKEFRPIMHLVMQDVQGMPKDKKMNKIMNYAKSLMIVRNTDGSVEKAVTKSDIKTCLNQASLYLGANKIKEAMQELNKLEFENEALKSWKERAKNRIFIENTLPDIESSIFAGNLT